MRNKETRAFVDGGFVKIEIAGQTTGTAYPCLTKAERHAIYEKAFNTFRVAFSGPFLCNVLKEILIYEWGYKLPSGFTIGATQITRAFFPEIAPLLPEDLPTGDGRGWPMTDEWNEHRSDVLMQCIIETK